MIHRNDVMALLLPDSLLDLGYLIISSLALGIGLKLLVSLILVPSNSPSRQMTPPTFLSLQMAGGRSWDLVSKITYLYD